uniref:ribonuclease H n=1 Tax=Gasterosteus aculeatus aculeatus TaxID=481459 RepID=A0AAQ4RED7_GASAC
MYRITGKATNSVILTHEQVSRDHGCEKTDHPCTATLLEKLPDYLWSEGPTDVGFCNACKPVTFEVHHGHPIWQPQYPHKPAAAEGIKETIEGLVKSGVLEPSQSAWNTPILPVEKTGTGKYRMAHDLRKINDILVTTTVPVPNPYTTLTSLTPQQQWFTCIDLANAFFCLLLHKDLRDVFSFTYGNRQLRYTRLPQGFAPSPGIFNQVLKQALTGCSLPEGTTLIQYVDDILLASTSVESCLEATDTVLRRLAKTGFKVSKSKLQVARRQVSFLGRVLSGSGSGFSAAHRSSILHHPRPQNV